MKPNSSDERWRARIEALLGAARTPPLSEERRNALRLRIMRELPRQAGRPLRASVARAGRTAGPALLACLLAAIAGAWLLGGVPGSGGGGPLVARATGDVQVNGGGSGDARPGDVIVARSGGDVAIGGDVHVGMGAGAALTFSESGQRVGLDVRAGSVTVRSDTREVAVSRGDWGASLQPSSEATFAVDAQSAVVSVSRGDVTVVSQGQTYGVTSSTSPQSFATTPSPADPTPSPMRRRFRQLRAQRPRPRRRPRVRRRRLRASAQRLRELPPRRRRLPPPRQPRRRRPPRRRLTRPLPRRQRGSALLIPSTKALCRLRHRRWETLRPSATRPAPRSRMLLQLAQGGSSWALH